MINNVKTKNIIERGIYFLSYIPLFWLFTFSAFISRAYFKLGKLPIPYYPDPKSLGFDNLHLFTWLLGILSISVLPIIFGYSLFQILNDRSNQISHLKISLFSIAFSLVIVLNPFGLVYWFLD